MGILPKTACSVAQMSNAVQFGELLPDNAILSGCWSGGSKPVCLFASCSPERMGSALPLHPVIRD
jgi:hypothetical protein